MEPPSPPDAELEQRDRESEVLEKINVHDGDAFRARECPKSNPPMPKIDREARRRALVTMSTSYAFRTTARASEETRVSGVRSGLNFLPRSYALRSGSRYNEDR